MKEVCEIKGKVNFRELKKEVHKYLIEREGRYPGEEQLNGYRLKGKRHQCK